MGSVNLDNTGSGSAITLSSDGTNLLLNGTAVGGGGDKYIQIIAVEKATAIANGTDIIGAIEIPFAGTITSMRAKTISGTCTVTVKKGGSSLGTISATSSGVNTTVNSSVAAFDDITFDVASASGSGLVITLTLEL